MLQRHVSENKWNEVGVTRFLSKTQTNQIMKRYPSQKIVGTRWVLTEKVIQGKQDLSYQGVNALFMTLLAAAQDGWRYNVFDAPSAYLQSDGVERLLLLRMPHKNLPPGRNQGKCFVATVSIYGTQDAGRLVRAQQRPCAQAPLEATDWHSRALWPNHLPGRQSKSAQGIERIGVDLG